MLLSVTAQEVNPISINVEVDLHSIEDIIEMGVSLDTDPSIFADTLAQSTFEAAGRVYNVLVFNLAEDHETNIDQAQIIFYGSTLFDGKDYGIWALGGGEFTNKGDDTPVTWAYRGWLDSDQDGMHLTFHDHSQDNQLFLGF